VSSLDSSSKGSFFNVRWPSVPKDSGRINCYSSNTSLPSLCIGIEYSTESSIDSSTEGSFFNNYSSNTSLA